MFCEDFYVWINFWIYELLGLVECCEDIELNFEFEFDWFGCE